MRLGRYELTLSKAAVPAPLVPVPIRTTRASSFMGVIKESFTGAWQRNIVADPVENLLAFSAVYACVSLIADDISKLRIKLDEQNEVTRIWTEVDHNSPFLPVLVKPNRYQTRIQFLNQWIVCKLLYGNTYVLKERNQANVVKAMYILDPRLVTVLVADDSSVWYRISRDSLSGIALDITVPASEIIHDRAVCLFHPLIGVSPIYACGASGTQGRKIQSNSEVFFANMSRPSGQLTSPATISDITANRMKAEFEANFSQGNIGRLLVAGDGLKFEPFTIPAQDSQLIEQLSWTVEDVARCFHVPLHKIGAGQNVTFSNVATLNQDYYSQTLQVLIEAIELLLDEGLALPYPLGTELDLDGLLRMDAPARMEAGAKGVGAGILKPDEARAKENLPPVAGGGTPYMQQQNYSLAALAQRDAGTPFAKPEPAPAALPPPAAAEPAPTPVPQQESFADFLQKMMEYDAGLREGLLENE